MANAEHLQILRQGVKIWNGWREKNSEVFPALAEAKLWQADLWGANLGGANLSEARALSTNFTQAILTGACIQDWRINSETILENVNCSYIYFKVYGQERRPSDPNRNFKPGEFARLVEKYIETIDLIFKGGIDWQTFLTAFQELQTESENNELSVQAIEKKRNEVFVIRIEVPADANKERIEASFWDKYQPLLEAKDREIKFLSQQTQYIREDNTRLLGIIETMAEKENTKYDLRGSKFGGGFATEGGTQSGGRFNEYSITIGQNNQEINNLITSLHAIVQHFPKEQREEAEMELDDLAEEIKSPEKQDPKRFGKRLKRIVAAGTVAATIASGAATFSEEINTFTDNVTELADKLGVEIDFDLHNPTRGALDQ